MSDLVQDGVPHLVLVIHLHQVLRQRDFVFRMVALAKANLGAIKAERPLRRKPVHLHQVVGQFVGTCEFHGVSIVVKLSPVRSACPRSILIAHDDSNVGPLTLISQLSSQKEIPMSSLAVALKDEIRRLARKEIRQQTASMAQAVTRYRREIARLKRQTQAVERKIAFLEEQERRRLKEPESGVEMNGKTRFSARSVKAQRRRTGLSAADNAQLVGVSANGL